MESRNLLDLSQNVSSLWAAHHETRSPSLLRVPTINAAQPGRAHIWALASWRYSSVSPGRCSSVAGAGDRRAGLRRSLPLHRAPVVLGAGAGAVLSPGPAPRYRERALGPREPPSRAGAGAAVAAAVAEAVGGASSPERAAVGKHNEIAHIYNPNELRKE